MIVFRLTVKNRDNEVAWKMNDREAKKKTGLLSVFKKVSKCSLNVYTYLNLRVSKS